MRSMELRPAGGQPLLTVITASYNRVEFLGEAIASTEKYGDRVEHVVVDGGSTDGTLELLQKHPRIVWISEPDTGVYDAWNKGLILSSGRFVGFLNSDDVYIDNGFSEMLQRLGILPRETAIAGGQFEIVDLKGRCLRRSQVERKDDSICLSRLLSGDGGINAKFFRRTVFAEVGVFDAGLSVLADIDFLLRCYRDGMKYESNPVLVYRYRHHPESLTMNDVGLGTNARSEAIEVAGRHIEDFPHRGDRLTVRRWRAEGVGGAVLRLLKSRDVREAVATLRKGLRIDPMWPILFLPRLVELVKNRFVPVS